jgi:hypothetical protein
MGRDKKLMDKTTDVVTGAAQTVTKGLKRAGRAVAEAMTPKPVGAGDTLIIPSADPSIPPVVVPVKKRARRTKHRTRTASGRGGKASAGKPASKRRTSRTTTAKSRTATKRTPRTTRRAK